MHDPPPPPPRPTGSLALPAGTAPLTAAPTDDFGAQEWVTLHAVPTAAPPAAFWHVVRGFTGAQHWNRTICSVRVTAAELVARPPDHPPHAPPAPDALRRGMRYNALRRLRRKTPAPIGGDAADGGGDDAARCYHADEWTAQFVQHAAGEALHVAVFGLCIPSSVVTDDNPRAMRYWPFQYPKVRAYRFVYAEKLNVHMPPSEPPPQPAAELRYQVLPLGEDARSPRSYDTLVHHSRKAAEKMLTLVRKRLDKYDPVVGASTYVKRVHHDNLITEDEYRARYDAMKLKYSFWVDQWTECTDPKKFVYEELSIAAYLCALWKREREQERLTAPQTFIDCGCGNGFLVYLLISEGHPGIGVDLQRRNIWDKYPAPVRDALRHEHMDPVTYDVSPYDWVLGNHSDELCPWIPVMTARAQISRAQRRVCEPPSTLADEPAHTLRRAYPRFFVLPCCFFDFDGKKISFGRTRRTLGVRVVAGTGKYEQYYRWIARIGRAFGFTSEYENLRIPSTKYVSILGRFIEFEQRVTPEVIREMTSLLLLDARQSRL